MPEKEYRADVIGGFEYKDTLCAGCGKPLELANAWMTDGCPCNTPLGVNNRNETRWRLLMQLQQAQAREIERLKKLRDEWCSEFVLIRDKLDVLKAKL